MTPYPPERMMEIVPRYHVMAREHGNIHGFWTSYCEPRIQQATREIAAMGSGATIRTAAETWMYGFHQTFTSSALLGEAQMRLTALLAEHAPADAQLLALEATQGGDNASQEIDREIWNLAEIARSTPAVRQILTSEGDDALASLRAEPGAGEFITTFDSFVARQDARSQGWSILLETWGERPQAPLALVRAQLEADHVSAPDVHERSTASRAAGTERALAALPESKHEAFHAIVRELDGYVAVREGRAYCQIVITGTLRLMLLRRGDALVRSGRIERADDILFLVPEEVESGGAAPLHDTVAQRRAEWSHWCTLKTPPFIGTPASLAALAEAAREAVRGAPASRGTVTGTARILRSPEEGHRMGPGDILVCEMTTPAWTPLFAIAAGIVTETGGPLSHPAITAREYRIPAVVALDGATTRIRDGQTITIDGGTGEVTLHAS
jgi:pyruvate,water dikinase